MNSFIFEFSVLSIQRMLSENSSRTSSSQEIQVPDGDLLIPIEANVEIARERFMNELKITTIHKCLNIWAKKIVFSATLTNALKIRILK